MKVLVGTSGYSYKEWRGAFYPQELPAKEMLRFYAGRFSTVEINNTFYRMPSRENFEHWAAQVPPGFQFGVKAPQRITHRKRLLDSADDVAYLFDIASALGGRLGPVLFQLPPNFKKDLARLHDFVAGLPTDRTAAFEFRHPSWADADVHRVLSDAGIALCAAQTDENPDELILPTAKFGYLRLRKTEYTSQELRDWSRRVLDQPWDSAFVYFKHEDEARGPRFAAEFLSGL